MNDIQRYRPPSPARLLAHILEDPALVAAVRELPAPMLGALIDRIGLEDAGELVALASTEQLSRVFDEDLWTSERAGEDPHFDPGRFAAWLQVMLEAGEAAVVERLCELPLDFVILCVQRLVLVIDIDALGIELSEAGEDGEAIEKALDSCLYEEWEEFRLIARDAAAWDPMLATLLALDREHHDVLRRILERCCAIGREFIEENGGLYEVLTSDEMLENDVRADRDDRRAAQGHVAPSDARAFLELARTGQGSDAERDPITRAYFRELAPERARPLPKRPAGDVARLTRLLADAQAKGPGVAGALPPSAGAGRRELDRRRDARLLDVALAALREQDAVLYARRLEEIGYLANVLVAGWARGGVRLRPVEGLETAVAVCDAALRHELAAGDGFDAALALLGATPLDLLFRKAWPAFAAKLRG